MSTCVQSHLHAHSNAQVGGINNPHLIDEEIEGQQAEGK